MKLRKNRVLITGGAGFLGRHLAKSLIGNYGCQHIKIFSRDEHKHEDMAKWADDIGLPIKYLRFIIGDVCDTDLLKWAIRDVDYVVHAAALKIIPAMQYNPVKAIDVNLNGWMSVVKAALDNNKALKVIGVSSDKAVEPLNTYGKAKALGEDLFIHTNVYSPDIRFSCVRYGNVIGSTSSLLAKFQGKNEAPTLTHEGMTRFFIPIGMAVDLVLYAMTAMHGGEIFVPKCHSCRVKDLIEYVSGCNNLRVTGMRPGEKINEVLVNRYEATRTIEVKPHYYVILPEEFSHNGFIWEYPEPGQTLFQEYRSDSENILIDKSDFRRVFGVKEHESD